jgi:hypothetical protein
MSTTVDPKVLSSALPSVFNAKPEDLGGIHARKGFAYQDEVAAGFYIKMLLRTDLIEVACETYDDIRLIWQKDTEKTIEFVQVKAENLDQLWSIAKLCERSKSATKPDGVGSSILEKSLSRDKFQEPSWFRIVTCRQIHPSLELLEACERGHEYRSVAYSRFKTLAEEVGKRLNGTQSAKGNDTTYWLINACWDVISEGNIQQLNHQSLTTALHSIGCPSDPDTVTGIYTNLLALAKETAEYDINKWQQKAISRNQLFEKIKSWLNPYPELVNTEKLERKLTDAGLDQVCIDVAKDQKRYYLHKRRQSGYLDTEQVDDLDCQILDRLHVLRASLDSGEITENGINFHARCLNEVRTIKPVAPVIPGYMAGCMYEITARCRHRFIKLLP